MKNHLRCFIFLFLFSLVGCSASRFQSKGDIVNEGFYEEIPFRYEQNVIVVDVVINGSHFNFMWDTGAELNVVDRSVVEQLKLETSGELSINASDNSSQNLSRLAIPSFFIGSMEVQKSIAVVSDLTPIGQFLGCLELKGIIGNNVMRRANMQIDYERKIIIMTDRINPFTHSENAIVYKLNKSKNGNVKLPMKIGDTEESMTFDSGYGGNIKSNNEKILEMYSYVSSSGVTGANLHGVNRGVVYDALVGSGEMAGIPFKRQVVRVNKEGSSLVGNEFLDHFTISANWDKRELVFDPIETIQPDTLDPFELSLAANFHDLTVKVSKIYPDHTEFDSDLIGWEVVKINDTDMNEMNLQELCAFWESLKKQMKKMDSIEAVISKEDMLKNIKISRIQAVF